MFGLSVQELMIVGVVAILLFGKRLPEVAKTMGGYYRKLRGSMDELRSTFDLSAEINRPLPKASASRPARRAYDEDDYEPTAPRFDPPPPAEPTVPRFQATPFSASPGPKS